MFFHPKNLKSENNNPWFKPWFDILLHTQSIVCATVDSQFLEYLGYITLHWRCICVAHSHIPNYYCWKGCYLVWIEISLICFEKETIHLWMFLIPFIKTQKKICTYLENFIMYPICEQIRHVSKRYDVIW